MFCKRKEKTKNFKGKDIEYIEKVTYCNECGSEIFVPEIRDNNLAMLDKAYQQRCKTP